MRIDSVCNPENLGLRRAGTVVKCLQNSCSISQLGGARLLSIKLLRTRRGERSNDRMMSEVAELSEPSNLIPRLLPEIVV